MTDIRDHAGLDGFLAENGYLDPAVEAARARAMVWQIAQKATRQEQPGAPTLAGLSAMVARSAAHALDMDEDALMRLLRNHRPH